MKNMKQLNIKYIDFGTRNEAAGSSGIERKILAQIKELTKIGTVTRVLYGGRENWNFLMKLCGFLPFFPSIVTIKYVEELNNSDIVYIRRAFTDRYTVKLLKKIRYNNPECIILMEIPTFPYDMEMKGRYYPLLVKDRWNRRKFQKYIDRIVLVASREPVVFGIPTLTITNGIDFSVTSLRKIAPIAHDEIHAIIVGNYAFWHGLDRLIEGIKLYYGDPFNTRKFILHVVGPTKQFLDFSDKDIINLIDRGVLYLYGELPFDTVEAVYDKVSLAFSSLGIHRISMGSINSSVKSREYSAKGLPIISDSKIDFISEGYKYFYKISEDDTALNIQNIITFHDEVYSRDSTTVANEIRAYAEKYCSSEAMMKPVVDYCRAKFTMKQNSNLK